MAKILYFQKFIKKEIEAEKTKERYSGVLATIEELENENFTQLIPVSPRLTICQACPAGRWMLFQENLSCYCEITKSLSFDTRDRKIVENPLVLCDLREKGIRNLENPDTLC